MGWTTICTPSMCARGSWIDSGRVANAWRCDLCDLCDLCGPRCQATAHQVLRRRNPGSASPRRLATFAWHGVSLPSGRNSFGHQNLPFALCSERSERLDGACPRLLFEAERVEFFMVFVANPAGALLAAPLHS